MPTGTGTETTITQAAFIPEVYAALATTAFNRALIAKNYLEDMTYLFADGGTKAYIPSFMGLTTAAVKTKGESTDNTYASTYIEDEQNTLEITKHLYTSREFTPKLADYARPKQMGMAAEDLGRNLAQYVDVDLFKALAGYSDLTAIDLSSADIFDSSITDAEIIQALAQAVLALREKDVPVDAGDIAFILDARFYSRLTTVNGFTSIDYSNNRAIESGVVGRFGGIPILSSNNLHHATVSGTDTRYNLLVHKSAAVIATPKPIQVKYSNIDFSSGHFVNAKMTATIDYGYASRSRQAVNSTDHKNYSLINILTQAA